MDARAVEHRDMHEYADFAVALCWSSNFFEQLPGKTFGNGETLDEIMTLTLLQA